MAMGNWAARHRDGERAVANWLFKTVRGIRSVRVVCYRCGALWARIPASWDGDGVGEQCDRCGNTSTRTKSARVIGPRSRYWRAWREEMGKIIYWSGDDDWVRQETEKDLVR